MKRAKIRRPEAIKLSDAEIDARCDHILRLMDAHLKERDWLALDRPTIADVSCFGPISMLKVSGYDTDKWPSVTRWLERDPRAAARARHRRQAIRLAVSSRRQNVPFVSTISCTLSIVGGALIGNARSMCRIWPRLARGDVRRSPKPMS